MISGKLPPARLPVTESTPLRNPFWQYSRDKIACEDLLVTAYRDEAFPATIVHVPSDAIAAADAEWGAGLLGDKAHSMAFDNAKVRIIVGGWRATVPFERGAREIADWYLADASRQVTDSTLDALMDKLAADFAVA